MVEFNAAALDAAVRSLFDDPAAFGEVAALAHAANLSERSLSKALRDHFHIAPQVLLRRARIRRLAALLAAGSSIEEAAEDAGLERSTLDEAFVDSMHMPVRSWQRWVRGETPAFELTLPAAYRADEILGYAARLGEATGAGRVSRSMLAEGQPVTLAITFRRGVASCEVVAAAPLGPAGAAALHQAALRIAGLSSDPEPFESWIDTRPALRPLVDGRRGMRLPCTPTLFEALAWSIIGQQVNVTFATALQADLVALCGLRAPDGALAYPDAGAVARLDYADLTSRRFSRSKAEYLIDAARLVATGELPLEHLAEGSATRAREALVAVRGIGPWSANYIMMRGFAFDDCLPLGDTGLTSGLQTFFRLKKRPDAAATVRLMRRFAPYRTWATLHLWMTKYAASEQRA